MVDARSDILALPRPCETRLSSAPAVSVRLGRQRDWFMNSGSRRRVGPVRHTPGMGGRNRERRTTKKQRRRSAADREHRPSDTGPDRAPLLSAATRAAIALCQICHQRAEPARNDDADCLKRCHR